MASPGALFPVVPSTRRHATEVVAMLHIHSTTAILNHGWASAVGVATPTFDDLSALAEAVAAANALVDEACRADAPSATIATLLGQVCNVRSDLRSVVALVFPDRFSAIVETLRVRCSFVAAIVARAVAEAETYHRHGITHMEVENVAAPYFIGAGKCPWEEIFVMHAVTRAVREAPFGRSIVLGMHILSCNELEALPLAIAFGAAFVRAEATLFSGLRPEGFTTNHGNLARFFYVRNVLNTWLRIAPTGGRSHPQVWSDVQKKHTVFLADELAHIDTWLENAGFMKLEGVIVTGPATGSNCAEADLVLARKRLDEANAWYAATFAAQIAAGTAPVLELPLVTGSGSDWPLYCRTADYMIVGSAFKRAGFWENEVDEARVVSTLAAIAQHQRTPKARAV